MADGALTPPRVSCCKLASSIRASRPGRDEGDHRQAHNDRQLDTCKGNCQSSCQRALGRHLMSVRILFSFNLEKGGRAIHSSWKKNDRFPLNSPSFLATSRADDDVASGIMLLKSGTARRQELVIQDDELIGLRGRAARPNGLSPSGGAWHERSCRTASH